jgi:myo-inositol 2-dehydrogenase/D-chiro-inositol 1-dehydrogenase
MKEHIFTRRDFLKTTSTAAILGSLSLERSVHAASTDTLKIALVGAGGRGSGAANQALSADPNLKLVAIADAFEDRLSSSIDNLKKAHGDKVDVPKERQFVGFEGYKQAIALADVVILATPPGFRPAHFEEAVRQGKHVFMEKPVAVDAPGVRKVLAAAEESKKKNLKVGVGLQRRHQDSYIEAIKRIQDGALGDIILGRAYWNGGGVWVHERAKLEQQAGRKLTEMEYQMRNWYYFNWLCGDHIVEQHIHNIDIINWIKNATPIKAQGQGGREVRNGIDHGEIFDHHFVEFEYADGSKMLSQCRHIQGTWSQVSEHVHGTKGAADLDNSRGGVAIFKGENKWRYKAENTGDPYQIEHNKLFAAIRNDTAHNEAEFGAKSTMTSIMGRMATYSGKMIEWEQALNSTIDLMPKAFAWDAEPPLKPDANGYYPVAVPGVTIAV